MSTRIKVLSDELANKIAAGEVVERPASVVKELAENALDAGAGRVFVDAEDGGARLMRVVDDGCGMGADDALLAFERHSTSKLSKASELSAIHTLGFRGEAVPSIASVSRLRLTTAVKDGSPGTLVVIEGGSLLFVKEAGAPKGTCVEVRDLFFNTPARLKFLKSTATEFSHIASAVQRMALVNPSVHFRLTHNGRDVLDCPPSKRPVDRVAQVFGSSFAGSLLELGHDDGRFVFAGFVSRPGVSFPGRSRIEMFVNGRPVKALAAVRALYDAYGSLLMKGRHPAAILDIRLDPSIVDVNVHPAKREVRFADASLLHGALREAVAEALRGAGADVPDFTGGRTGRAYESGVRQAAEDYVSSAGMRPDRAPWPGYTPAHAQGPRQDPLGLGHAQKVAPLAPGSAADFYRPSLIQVADSYIVVPEQDGCMVVDQHAAHERIHYEKIKARMKSRGGGSQGLLVPEKIELSAKESALMQGILDELGGMGIDVEQFGGTTYLIRSKPLFMEKADIKDVVTGILAGLEEKDVSGGVSPLREKIVQLMSCKAAVKAGQRLHPHAMERLVAQLFECESPFTCAHGRPTFIRFSLDEFERMFKRR